MTTSDDYQRGFQAGVEAAALVAPSAIREWKDNVIFYNGRRGLPSGPLAPIMLRLIQEQEQAKKNKPKRSQK